jgi:hypothetical protein
MQTAADYVGFFDNFDNLVCFALSWFFITEITTFLPRQLDEKQHTPQP